MGTPPFGTRVLWESMRPGVRTAAQVARTVTARVPHHVALCDESSRREEATNRVMPCEPAPQLLIKQSCLLSFVSVMRYCHFQTTAEAETRQDGTVQKVGKGKLWGREHFPACYRRPLQRQCVIACLRQCHRTGRKHGQPGAVLRRTQARRNLATSQGKGPTSMAEQHTIIGSPGSTH